MNKIRQTDDRIAYQNKILKLELQKDNKIYKYIFSRNSPKMQGIYHGQFAMETTKLNVMNYDVH